MLRLGARFLGGKGSTALSVALGDPAPLLSKDCGLPVVATREISSPAFFTRHECSYGYTPFVRRHRVFFIYSACMGGVGCYRYLIAADRSIVIAIGNRPKGGNSQHNGRLLAI